MSQEFLVNTKGIGYRQNVEADSFEAAAEKYYGNGMGHAHRISGALDEEGYFRIVAGNGAEVSIFVKPKRPPGRPPATYKTGEGAPKKSVRLEGDLLAFVDQYPGGLKGVVEFAYKASKT